MGNVIISHNQRKDNMTTHKTFYITYYARTHNGITNGLTTVFVDNPKLMDYLKEKIKEG